MLILQHPQGKPKWDSIQTSTQRQGCKTYGLWNFSTRGLSMRSAFLCKWVYSRLEFLEEYYLSSMIQLCQ